jgi:hypothetical protein
MQIEAAGPSVRHVAIVQAGGCRPGPSVTEPHWFPVVRALLAVNTMCWLEFPTAESVPFTVRPVPELNFTLTPGWTVRVTPAFTVTELVTT